MRRFFDLNVGNKTCNNTMIVDRKKEKPSTQNVRKTFVRLNLT